MAYSEFKQNRLCVTKSSSETVTFNDKIYKDEVGKVDLKETDAISYGEKSIDYKKWGNNGEIYLSASIKNGEGGDRDKDNKAILRLNAMSYMRTISHFSLQDESHVVFFAGGTEKNANEATAAGYSIMYLALVIQTIMFLFIYGKRVLQMAFLTMIAPIVALMYPVDKLGDGKAQAFNTWFRDYLFNMLIQPMHLLLYTVFIVAARELVQRNILYALMVYAFMIPAEKYFKKMLGFEKASNGAGGPLGGAIGHSLAMDGLGKLAGIGPAGHGGGKGESSGDSKNRPKVKKMSAPDRSNIPHSGGTPGSAGGTPGSAGGAPGSAGGAPGSTGGTPRSTGGTPRPTGGTSRTTGGTSRTTGGTPNSGGSRGPATLLKNAAVRGIRRAVTGGQNASKRKGFWGDAVAYTGKKVGRLGARGLGALAMGSAGLIAGAATAVATGDINNLWKGATVGVSAGNKMGGNIFDNTTGFIENFADDMRYERAMTDDDAKKEFRREEAAKKFDTDFSYMDDDTRKKYEDALDEASPYIDFGSIDDIDAYLVARKQCSNADDAINLYKDAGQAYNIETNEGTFMGSQLDLYNSENHEEFSQEQIRALTKAKNHGVDVGDRENIRAKADEIRAKDVKDRTDWEKETFKVLDYFANSASDDKINKIKAASDWTKRAIEVQKKRK